VQLPGKLADLFVEDSFDERMNVFVRGVRGYSASESAGNREQSSVQLLRFFSRQNASAGQSLHPRSAAINVLAPQSLIGGQTAIEVVQ
jgi:hypothetical protein